MNITKLNNDNVVGSQDLNANNEKIFVMGFEKTTDFYLQLNNNEYPSFDLQCIRADRNLDLEMENSHLSNGDFVLRSTVKDLTKEDKDRLWEAEYKFLRAMYGEDDRKYNPKSTYKRRSNKVKAAKENRRRLANNHMCPSYNRRSNHMERGIIKGRPGGTNIENDPMISIRPWTGYSSNPNPLLADHDPSRIENSSIGKHLIQMAREKTYKQALVDDDKFRRSENSEHAYVRSFDSSDSRSNSVLNYDESFEGNGDIYLQTCFQCKKDIEHCDSMSKYNRWCLAICRICKFDKQFCKSQVNAGKWCKRNNENPKRGKFTKKDNDVVESSMKTHHGEQLRNQSKVSSISDDSTILVTESLDMPLKKENFESFIDNYYSQPMPYMKHNKQRKSQMVDKKIKKSNDSLIEKSRLEFENRQYIKQLNLQPTLPRETIISMNPSIFIEPIEIKIPLSGIDADSLFGGITELGNTIGKFIKPGNTIGDTFLKAPGAALAAFGATGSAIAKGIKHLKTVADLDPSFLISYEFQGFVYDIDKIERITTDTSDDTIKRGDPAHMDALLSYFQVTVRPFKCTIKNDFVQQFRVIVSLELFFQGKNSNICNNELSNDMVRTKIHNFVNTNTKVRWTRYISAPIQNDTAMFIYAHHLSMNALYNRDFMENNFPKNDVDKIPSYKTDNLETEFRWDENGMGEEMRKWEVSSSSIKKQNNIDINKMVTVGYGYSYGEVKLPDIGDIKEIRIRPLIPEFNEEKKPVISHSGFGTIFAEPHADLNDARTSICGVLKRVACKPFTPIPGIVEELKKYNKKLINKLLVPVDKFSDLSFETWLSQTNYTESRKNELRKAFEKTKTAKWEDIIEVGAFTKDEQYPLFKHLRKINARNDMFKTLIGPIVKAIEKIVFSLPYFIKKIPNKDRPAYIKDLFNKKIAMIIEGDDALAKAFGIIFGTDFTAFESHFTEEMMSALETPLYEHMTSELDDQGNYLRLFDVLKGNNHIVDKFYTLDIPATRMSGEMNTSLGNSWSNFVILKFLLHKHKRMLTEKDYRDLGFNVKLEVFKNLGEASFCGMIFNEDVCDIIVDPRKALSNFSWNTDKYTLSGLKKKRELLKCKALSYIHMYPRCPIIRALCNKVLELIPENLRVRQHFFSSNYLYERFVINHTKELPNGIIKFETRQLMADKFGITIEDQCSMERTINSLTHLGIFVLPEMHKYWNSDVIDYTNTYVKTLPIKLLRNHSLSFPTKKEYLNVSNNNNVMNIVENTVRGKTIIVKDLKDEDFITVNVPEMFKTGFTKNAFGFRNPFSKKTQHMLLESDDEDSIEIINQRNATEFATNNYRMKLEDSSSEFFIEDDDFDMNGER